MSESERLRVLIVDDHALVRNGIADFIFSFDRMEPVGEVRNGAQAVEFCATHEVDVVLDGSGHARHGWHRNNATDHGFGKINHNHCVDQFSRRGDGPAGAKSRRQRLSAEECLCC